MEDILKTRQNYKNIDILTELLKQKTVYKEGILSVFPPNTSIFGLVIYLIRLSFYFTTYCMIKLFYNLYQLFSCVTDMVKTERQQGQIVKESTYYKGSLRRN